MTRSPPAELSKPSKRKGTRSVSTLTPSQLARKRANDREAQRAIRARTKEHIERLEREVAELKSGRNRDEMVADLIKRNKALEREISALRESMGYQGRHPYSQPDSNRPLSSEYTPSSSSFGASYLPTPEPCDSWPTALPVSSVSVPSGVSSPSSSSAGGGGGGGGGGGANNPEDYVPAPYIPTSVPSSMMESQVIPSPGLPSCLESTKIEYEELDNGAHPNHRYHHSPTGYIQHQSWSVYPPTFYPQSPAM